MAVRHHIKVLVTDSDAQHARHLQQLLEDAGYLARVEGDLAEAFKLAQKESCQIALVDLSASASEALELVEKIKGIDRRNSVLVMRGGSDFESAVEAMRRGACEYLRKPVGSSELSAALDRTCRRMGLIHTNEEELNRLIGERIRRERLAQNLTLRQLSDRTNLTTSQLSQVELGKNAASVWALARISNALGRQLSAMLEGL
ncbi:MAG: response regulator [Phycisphaerae bacterium]|nr:response regulator [Planctomycetia bacterium]MCK6465099.1 response regulator [Phycisphaerae bacterium]MCL4717230.1 response regulator [Phycisphaerae bacterium]NUQ07963.1 response regulator [Phycisphaerae bacterium]